MDQAYIMNHWAQVRHNLEYKWAKLTEQDLDHIRNNMNFLAHALHNQYGMDSEKARQTCENFWAGYPIDDGLQPAM